MKLKAVEIAEILKQEIANIDKLSDVQEVGQVITVGDGIAKVYGIDNVEANEVVEFSSGVKGLALNLEMDSVSVILLGDDRQVEQGDTVKRTKQVLQVSYRK